MSPPLPWAARCRCGRIEMQVSQPPLLSIACHCHGCQTMTASAFSLTLVLPADGFAVVTGAAERGGLQTEHRHMYCGFCKSWLYTQPAGLEQYVMLRPSTLDEHSWVTPFVEVRTRQKLPWAATPARHSYLDEPAPEEYAGLIAEYSAMTAHGRG